MKQLLVLSTVIFSVLSSLILNFATNFQNKKLLVFLFLGIVIVLNIFKFILWGYIHKNYKISKSYPLTSIFFPIIFIISIVMEELNFSLHKLFAVLLILSGIVIFEFKKL